MLAVQAVVSLNEDQLAKVELMKPEDKRSLFLSLFSKLDRSEYLFMLQEDFSSKSWLRIQRTLYVEDLTRSSLLFEMKDLNTKFVNVNYDLNDALESVFGESLSPSSPLHRRLWVQQKTTTRL